MLQGSSIAGQAAMAWVQFLRMLHYFKFRQDLFAPVPAKEVYIKRAPGQGWPEECPPIRAANAFGFDLLANFDVTFVQSAAIGEWRKTSSLKAISITRQRGFARAAARASNMRGSGRRGRSCRTSSADNVYDADSQPGEGQQLSFSSRPIRTNCSDDGCAESESALAGDDGLIDTDWYPASYPWHVCHRAGSPRKRISIRKGEPICRVIPVRRDTYFAQQMSPADFDDFSARGQQWLATHGTFEHSPVADITKTYVRQQVKSKFAVITSQAERN